MSAGRLMEELRAKYPRLAARAARQPLAAIRLHCLECMGGSPAEVRACQAADCALLAFRQGHGKRGQGCAGDGQP